MHLSIGKTELLEFREHCSVRRGGKDRVGRDEFFMVEFTGVPGSIGDNFDRGKDLSRSSR